MDIEPALDPPEVAALRDLHRMLVVLDGEQHLSDVLEAAAQGVSDILGFGGVAINLLTAAGDFEAVTVVGPGQETVLGSRNNATEFLAELASADEWGLLRFVPAGRYVPGEGVASWSTSEQPRDHPDAWFADDALYAPLRAPDGDLVGILSVDLPANGLRPTSRVQTILEMYAAQIGLAVSRAQEREALRERVRLSTATRQIVSHAAEAIELTEVLAASVAPLVEGFRAHQTWIRLLADEGGAWAPVDFPADLAHTLVDSDAADGAWPRIDVDRVLRSGARLAGRSWERRSTVVVSTEGHDTNADLVPESSRKRMLDWLAGVGHSEFVLVPLGSGDQCLGYVVLVRPAQVGPWTSCEESAALDVGSELGRVIRAARVRERERELLHALEELDAHKSQVITTVVHELKNPLAAILGNLELVRDDPGLATRAHRAIEASGRRMLALVQDMLTLTELRKPVAVEHGRVDLGAVVADVGAQLAIHAGRARVQLDLSEVEAATTVWGDQDELEKLVLNLVSNAVKFSNPGGVVRVCLQPQGEQSPVVFSVRDQGLGISAEDQQTLFDDFVRSSDPTARARPGSGLGLAIARRVTARHAGTIAIDSTLGEGSTFTVHLPATQPDASAEVR